MKPLLYFACWLFTSRAEWARIKGALARRVDPLPVPRQTFMPASHEEWKAFTRITTL